MTRWLVVVCVGALSCAGFRTIERGEYRRVFTREASSVQRLDAPQEVITRERHDDEVAAGVHRAVTPPSGWTAPWLSDVETLELVVGEVLELRVDESAPVDLAAQGACVELFWNQPIKRDGWKDGTDVTQRESTLFVRGVSPGAATLRLVGQDGPRAISVTVKKR